MQELTRCYIIGCILCCDMDMCALTWSGKKTLKITPLADQLSIAHVKDGQVGVAVSSLGEYHKDVS